MSGDGTPRGGEGMTVAVVVPAYRSVSLSECLQALTRQTHPPAEVLVSCRLDDELSRTSVAEAGDPVRVVDVEGGYIAGVNAGLAAAHSEVVAFTDDDAVPRPDWLERIVEHLSADPSVAGVGGRDEQPDADGPPAHVVGRLTPLGRLVGGHHLGVGPAREVDVLKGVNMAYRRAALGDLSFDERLLGEGMQTNGEIRFCLTLRSRGWKLIYDPTIVVDHYPGHRPAGAERAVFDPKGTYEHAHNEMLAFASGPVGMRRVLAVAYALVMGTRQHPGLLLLFERMLAERSVRGPWRRMRAATAGRIAALGTVRRRPVRSRVPSPRG